MKRSTFIKHTGLAGVIALADPFNISTAADQAKANLSIVDLQCEYLVDPVGIDVARPRLSWKLLAGTRGEKQTAYRIMIASTKKILDKGQADIWDSGLVASSQSALVMVEKELVSGQVCYWKVRVGGKDKNFSGWSPVARFTMGLLQPKDWEGDWIRHPDAPVEKHTWFRKNIVIESTPVTAFIYVASVGYHELYVNGSKVDNTVLAPALTRLDKRILYVSYDISAMLKKSANTIGIWYGPGWSRFGYFKTQPALKVQLNIEKSNGEKVSFASGKDWLCKISSSENTGGCDYNNNGGEGINAKDLMPGWNKVGFDDSLWQAPATVMIDAVLSAQMLPPSRIIETIAAKAITGTGPYKIDMGKNFTGWIKLSMKGLRAGDKVIINVADDPVSGKDFGQQSQYISNGNGNDLFQNRFNYMAGRYLTIEGLKQKPSLTDATGYAVATDLKRVGQFTCSNDLFNKIYETDLWTFRANTTEGFTSDCPHRERMGYGEENFATTWGCGLPNYDAGAYYYKLIRDWCDVQMENGWIHHTAPQINEHFGGPMWSSAPLNLSWEFYQAYGDKRLLETSYTTYNRWLNFLETSMSDGLLQPYTKPGDPRAWGKFLGDWAAPGQRRERGDSREALYFNNLVFVMNLQTFVKIAAILGKADDVEMYTQKLVALKKKVHAVFFDKEKNIYMQGQQVQLAFALLTGIVPENVRPAVYTNFEREIKFNKPYLDMGSSGLPVLLKYLIEQAERSDIVFEHVSKTTEPGYGHFIARGETTWPEYWNVDVASKIHTCYTGIAGWFIKSLGGIRHNPEQPGMQSFIIKPAMPGDLSFVKASAASLYGTISTNWIKSNDRIELNVSIPVNTTAKVYFPSNDVKKITEGGLDVQHANGVQFLEIKDGYAVFNVQSGNYQFISKHG